MSDHERPLSRKLRVLAGVDEEVLARVPGERARYTGLGGAVLGTSVIATVSMSLALSQITDGWHPLLVVPVLVWGLFILNLDRWLVSSSTGSKFSRRAWLLVPRLLLAGFFGVIIAEPLVLAVFDKAIEHHINEDRRREVEAFEKKLAGCNPVVGEPTDGCTSDDRIRTGTSPTMVEQELAARRGDARTLQENIARDTDQHNALEELARRECAGGAGPGLTGVPGDGPECRRLRKQADDYAAAHPVAPNKARLDEVNQQISGLESQASTAKSDYEKAITSEIRRRVDAMVGTYSGIGLLERFSALDSLTSSNGFLFAALWFVRLFFVVVDCLPVLVKIFGGVTGYDCLVEARTSSALKVDAEELRLAESRKLSELRVSAREVESAEDRRLTEIDFENRQHRATMSGRQEDAVDRLADLLVNGHRLS